MKVKKDLKNLWRDASKDDWKEALSRGRCLAGCDLEAHGKVCNHLYGYLLKHGNIKAFLAIDSMPMETHLALTSPNEPKEDAFRDILEPFVSTHDVDGFISHYQLDILVLRFVYDMSFEAIAKDMGSSINTIQSHLNKALETLKPKLSKLKGYLK